MSSWSEFAREAADLAGAFRRLFVGEDGVAIGFLATVGSASFPRIAPVCPIFCGDHVYLCAGGHTPKVRDLRTRPAYALHAFLGENDEELCVSGMATEVPGAAERSAVHDAIPFPAFDRADPVFRLSVDRARWVYWERVGQPDTRPIRRLWPSAER